MPRSLTFVPPLIAVIAAGAGAQSVPSLSWRRLSHEAASHAAMVFDTVRQRFVLQTTRTCEWDGVDWRDRTTTNRPNAAGALVFDSTRGRTVLFLGGVDGTSPQLWEYDGIDWTQRFFTGGPSRRYFPSVGYDPLRQCVVVYGGTAPDSSRLGDTWTWNGSTWQAISGSGPPTMSAAGMAFHSPTGRMLLCGIDLSGTGTETWTFDGTSWRREQPATVPAARRSPTLCEDPANGVVRMFGNIDPILWEWNGVDWTASPTPLTTRQEAAMACDASGTTLLRGGAEMLPFLGLIGFPGPSTSDTWQLTAGVWTRLHGTGPGTSGDVTMTYDLLLGRVLCTALFGQQRRTYAWSRDEWSELAGGRLPRLDGARGYFDPTRNRLVMFGGGPLNAFEVISQSPVDSLFEYDGVQWTQIAALGPAPRCKHSFVFDLTHGESILFGGHGAGSDLGDTWSWNGAQWRQLATAGPSPRYGAAMTADPFRSRVVLFGGTDSSVQVFGDTWEWDGVAWHQLTPALQPPPRYDAGLDFDPSRHRAVLVGGRTFSGLRADQWEWDGLTWMQTPGFIADSTNPLANAAIAFAGDGMLRVANNDTWLGTVTTATVTGAGSGCGAPPPILVAFGEPVLGSSSFALELHRAGAAAPVILGIGTGPAPSSFGLGCTLQLQSIDITMTGFANQTGYAVVAIPIPNVVALRGVSVAVQAAAQRSVMPLGFALSNGLSVRVGD